MSTQVNPWVRVVRVLSIAAAVWGTTARAEAATLRRVWNGAATLTGTLTTTTATLTPPINKMSAAFIVMSFRGNDSSPANMWVSGRIRDAATVEFQRAGGGAPGATVDIKWYVAEFASGVTVQRGSSPLNATNVNVPITAVDLTKAFPLITHRKGGGGFGDDDFGAARLTSATNLELSSVGTSPGTQVEWQIVEHDSVKIQSSAVAGPVSFASPDLAKTVTIAAVNPAKSWLIYSYRLSAGTPAWIGQKMMRGRVTNGTTLTFDRALAQEAGGPASTVDLNWYLVEFTDATTVQHLNLNFNGAGLLQIDHAITAVNRSNTIALGGHNGQGGSCNYLLDDNPGTCWFTFDLTSDTNLQVTRGLGGPDAAARADGAYWVIEFPALATFADMRSFAAHRDGDRTVLEWKTGRELRNLGFRIHREVDGRRTPIGPGLVASDAWLGAGGLRLRKDPSYAWADRTAADVETRYWLEDIDLDGASTWHGPVIAAARADDRPPDSPDVLRVDERPLPLGTAARALTRRVSPLTVARDGNAAAQVALAARPAAKLSIRHDGWYRVTQRELAAATGEARFPTGGDTASLRLFVDGREVPMRVTGADGQFDADDAIEFYGKAADTLWTDTRVYWLVRGPGDGLRIPRAPTVVAIAEALDLPSTVERRERSRYFTGLRNGDRSNFFGALVSGTSVDQTITVRQLARQGDEAVDVGLQGVSEGEHHVVVRLGGREIGRVDFVGRTSTAARFALAPGSLREGNNVVTLLATGGERDLSLVDFVRASYRWRAQADGDALDLTAPAGAALTVGGFSTADVRAFDVTDENAVAEMPASVAVRAHDFAAHVVVPSGADRRLWLQGGRTARAVDRIEPNRPSDWHRGLSAEGLVVIGPADLLQAMSPLVAARRRQGWPVTLVDVASLYDELSFGQPDPSAIRRFLAAAMRNGKPRAVLLVGDASFDARDFLGLGAFAGVPTRLVDGDRIETASDDWLVDFDQDGLPDLPIGRLPVRTPVEASVVAGKLARHQPRPFVGAQPNEIVLVTDSDPNQEFERMAASVAQALPPRVQPLTISRHALGDAEARTRLRAALASGPAVVDYLGHGSVDAWAETLLTSEDVGGMTGSGHAPVVVAMTCLNGFFHDAHGASLGEKLLTDPDGGAIAVLASSGFPGTAEQGRFNRELTRRILVEGQSLGEALRGAKAAISDRELRRTFHLLGDPTMQVVLPRPPASETAATRSSGCTAVAAPRSSAILVAALALLALIGARTRRPRR